MDNLLRELASKEAMKAPIITLGQRSVDGTGNKSSGKVRVLITDINRISHYTAYQLDASTEIREVKKKIVQDLWYGNNKEVMLEIRNETSRRELNDEETLESLLVELGPNSSPTINLCASHKICLTN